MYVIYILCNIKYIFCIQLINKLYFLLHIQEQELKKKKVKSLVIKTLNQKNDIEIEKDKDFFDEESEFLLEDYDQLSSVNDFEEISDEKVQYEGVKVKFDNLYYIS